MVDLFLRIILVVTFRKKLNPAPDVMKTGNGGNQGQGKVAINNGDEKRRYQKDPQQAQCVREIHLFLR